MPLFLNCALTLWRTPHSAYGPSPDLSRIRQLPLRSPEPRHQVGPPPFPGRPPCLPLQPLSPTCLLGPALGRDAPRPVPRGIEGCHTDHVGSVPGEVLELHAVLSQEKRLHPFCEVPSLGFPEINLWAQRISAVRWRHGFPPTPGSPRHPGSPSTHPGWQV